MLGSLKAIQTGLNDDSQSWFSICAAKLDAGISQLEQGHKQ